MESVNLNNGIYNNNNFRQPPNNSASQQHNNSANKIATELNLSMNSAPFDVNKSKYTNNNQLYNKPSNEKLSKQPYQV